MRLCVIGAGYVGLVTAACFAEMGNQVRCVERDRERVARLRRGEMPIYEPGLESILRDQLDAARLTFTASLAEGLADAEVVFIAVGTPCGEDGSADLSHVMAVAEQLGAQLRQACIVVNKSTVPVGTAERVEEIIRLGLARRRKRFRVAVASNPEFLKEGSAVDDFRRPDRVIIGSAEAQAGETLRQLYAPFLRNHERVLLMGRREAEFSKYAANAFLATKISFMNEMAGLCALTGVDIEDVRRGMGSDKRIGTHFIYAGCGYGGSCFPKDVRALIRSAEQQGFDSQILRAVEARNARQKELLFETLGELFQGRWQGRTVALWGLAFKPGTDDLREAPSLVLLEALLRHGVRVRAHDPVANAGVAARYPDALACAQLTLHDSPYAAVEGAVEEALEAGLSEIGIVTGRGKRSLEDHFDISYELEHQIRNTDKEKYLVGIRRLIDECTFAYTRQVEMKGLGHAILTGRPLIGDEPFAVVLADDLCLNLEGDSVLKQMVKLYNQFRCSIVAIQEVPPEETNKYGVIAGEMIRDDIFRVNTMVEKPKPEEAPSNLAIIGRYILTPDIFDLIEQTEPGKGGEIQITDALMKQAQDGCVLAYKFKGKRFDCGSAEGYIEATNFCYENLYKTGKAH
ncbi:nucleotide sugar dehydrogenase [Pseudomonas aeruginosa]